MFGSQIYLKMLLIFVLKIIVPLFPIVFVSSLFISLFSSKKKKEREVVLGVTPVHAW